MTDEELKELYEALEWYDDAIDHAIDYLCLEREDQTKAYNAIDKVITAEQQRRVTRSEDVQRAIQYQQKHIDEEMFAWEHTDEEWQSESGAEEQYHDFLNLHELAIQALEQMTQKPTSEDSEIRHAIGMMQNEIRNGKLNPLAIKCHQLSIRALEAYAPKEPCKWIGFTTSHFTGVKNFYQDHKYYRCSNCRHGSAIKSKFCPNCGRELKGDSNGNSI